MYERKIIIDIDKNIERIFKKSYPNLLLLFHSKHFLNFSQDSYRKDLKGKTLKKKKKDWKKKATVCQVNIINRALHRDA